MKALQTLFHHASRIKTVEMMKAQLYREQQQVLHFGENSIMDKTQTESTSPEGALKRTLGLVDLVCYGLGATIGAGIFVTAGVAANQNAGPAVVLCFLIAAFAAFMSGLGYAELASRVPISGTAMSYAYCTLGEGVAWFIGWNLSLEYGISAAAVARGWANYVQAFFISVGQPLPLWLVSFDAGNGVFICFLAIIIVVFSVLLITLGAETSSTVNVVMTFVNITIILFIITTGATEVNPINYSPFAPYGATGVITGAGIVFFSFIGFDTVASLAEETKRPERNLPLGILLVLGIVTILYVGVCVVITGMVPYNLINVDSPMSSSFESVNLRWASIVVSTGSVTTLSCTVLCSLFGQTRLLYRMANDGLIFKFFTTLKLNSIVIGVIVSALAMLFDVNTLSSLISIGTLIAFSVVSTSIIILRYEECDEVTTTTNDTDLPWYIKYIVRLLLLAFVILSIVSNALYQSFPSWPAFVILPIMISSFIPLIFFYILKLKVIAPTCSFAVPLVPIIPGISIFANIFIIAGLQIDTYYRLAIWTFIGALIYVFYGSSHSVLNNDNNDTNKKSNDNDMIHNFHVVVIDSEDGADSTVHSKSCDSNHASTNSSNRGMNDSVEGGEDNVAIPIPKKNSLRTPPILPSIPSLEVIPMSVADTTTTLNSSSNNVNNSQISFYNGDLGEYKGSTNLQF